MKEIEALIAELKKNADLYYQGEGSLLSDDEYDEKVAYLQTLTEGTEYENKKEVKDILEGAVAAGTTPTKEDSLVTHKVPMLSLDKANSLTDVETWFNRVQKFGGKMFRVQAKLDGFAIEARYENKRLVEISTRGDGSVGEDLSYLINHKEIKIVGLPLFLNTIENCSLRGELFARHSQFDEINDNRFKAVGSKFENSRNGVVGVIKKGKNALGYKAEVTFCTYSYLLNDEYKDLDDLRVAHEDVVTINELSAYELQNTGENSSLIAKDFTQLSDIITKFGEKRPEFDIPTDGAVIKPLEEAALNAIMGNTGHHPKAFIAFKYPSEKKPTKVIDIVFSVGKTGRVTPTAIVEPTLIAGTTVSRASCHNFDWLYKKGVRIGSTVMITKANDVIPAISSVLVVGDGDKPSLLKVCLECGEPLLIKDLKDVKCVNPTCPGVFFYKMRSATSKQGLDIDGLNNIGLQSLCESNLIKDVADLFTLTSSDLQDLPMGETTKGSVRTFGKKRAEKVVELIQHAKVSTPAYKLLNSIGFNGVGPSTAKLLLANFGSIEAIIKANFADLVAIPGVGEQRAKDLIEEQPTVKAIFDKMNKLGVIFDNGLAAQNSTEVKGHFSISGKVPEGFANRGAFTDYMATVGWVFDSSPKATTSILFGDENDTSSKVKKAKKLGIQIVNPDDYKTIL